MNTNQIRQLIKNLQIIMSCPRCGKKYNLDEIFLRGSSGSNYFLQMNCSVCHTPVYATIAVSGNLAEMIKSQVGRPLDIVAKPVTQTSRVKKNKITSDDIIQMHKFLDSFRGDFSNL